MKDKVLVTGGAGYLGSILVPMLLDYGFYVTVYDNFMRRVPSLYECVHDTSLAICRGDIRDHEKLLPIIEKNDIIIWLAAIAGAPACERDTYAAKETNIGSIERVITDLRPDQRIYYACTNAGYGTSKGHAAANESTPLRPLDLYGKTKVAGETLILEAGGTSLRLATLFGFSPRMRIDLLINDFVYRLLKDHYLMVYQGNYKRNAVHVRDAAKAFMHVIANEHRGVYNVGLPEANKTKLELAELIQEHIEGSVVATEEYHRDRDQRDFALDSTKLLRTGFHYDYNLHAGISELIKGYTMIENRRFCNVV